MGKKFLLAAVFALIGILNSDLFAQNKTITGTVVDSSGNPISGVSVKIKGTSKGAITNNQGEFKVNATEGQTLVVSAINYISQEIAVGNGEEYKIVLPGASNNADLNDVVVTAFGIKKDNRSLGYSVQTVKSDELTQASNNSFAGALQGKTAGVEITPSSGMPGASVMVMIRGARSFTGDNSPLYVIDGLPVSSGVDISTGNSTSGSDVANRAVDIDPNNIASITVLKGQTAAALYGINASNGAIIITTKTGSNGRARVGFSTSVSFDNVSRQPKLQSEYAQGSAGNYAPVTSLSWGPKISDLANDPNYGGNTNNQYTATGLHNGQYYVVQRAQAGLDPWATPQAYNNFKNFFNTGKTYNNHINISRGDDLNSYALSLGSANQTGVVPHTGMNRYSATLGAKATLSPHFKTGFNGTYTNETITQAPSANSGIMATIIPAPASYDLKGIPDHVAGDDDVPVNYRSGAYTNPYWTMEHDLYQETTNRFFGNGYVTYSTKFSDVTSLDVKYQLGADEYTTNYINLIDFGHPSENGGSIAQTAYTKSGINSLLTADFKWDINPSWKFDALLGNEYQAGNTEYKQQVGNTFSFAGWDNIDNTVTQSATEASTRNRNFGTFANLSLSYLSMLYLSLTGRQDIVSTMPSNNRTFYYPSASLGFVFTELKGLKNNSVLNYGKIRLSYAEVGQAGQYYPFSYTIPSYGGGFYAFTPITYPVGGEKAYILQPTLYDPNLKPQNTKNIEVGADLGFFNDLIEINYTYSRQNVDNQIFPVPLAGSTGFSSLMTNGGKIHTNSQEATLTINPIRQKDWDWNIGFNFSKVDNYVDALAPGVESIFLGGFTTPQVRASIGYKFPTIYGVTYARNDKGQVIVDDNGDPEAGAPGVIGSSSPNFTLGVNTKLRYKIFTLSAVLDWKSGGQMYSGTTGLLNYYGASKESAEARDRNSIIFPNSVNEDGTPNTTPITGYSNIQNYYSVNNNIDESSIVNASFLKLREVALLIQAVKKKKFGLDVNIFARNILLWTNSPQLDPESSQGNTNMAGAFERFTLPQTRSMGLGVNLNF